jgi:CO/xanthine dehydrogenase Mo-binding subunit
MGGAFGSRLVMDMLEPIASLLSKQTGRPVAIFNTRTDEFQYSAVRYPFLMELKTGVKNDGTLLARQAKVVVDNGAYHEKGLVTIANAALSFIYLYRIPHIQFEGSLVYTNNLHGSAFRGFGNPQITFAMESQMDIIAEKLGIDPAEIRLKNIFKADEKTASGAIIRGNGLSECIKQAARQSGWPMKRGGVKKAENVGMGMAIMIHTGGGARAYKYNAADAFIHVHEDGKANVLVGVSEHGQGAKTVLTQIVAEETGIPPRDISIPDTDTDVNPMDMGAFASRTTYVLGNAVRSASLDIKKQLVSTSAAILEANPEDLEIKNERIFIKGSPGITISVKDAIKAHYAKGCPLSGKGRFRDDIPGDLDPVTGYGDLFPVYSFSCLVASVKVDPDTGDVKVLELVSANDLGRVINPLGAEGQVEGALLQGLGYAFWEESIVKKGEILNRDFTDYKFPASQDLCRIKVILIESNEPTGPYGAKGIGEAAIVPVVPAIANAIYDAVGCRVNDLPFKKEKIFNLVKERPGPGR